METTTNGKAKMVVPLQPQLLNRARRLTGNEADARDLVQDTIERALRTSRAPAAAGEMRPWLYRVLTHLWIDRVRATRRRRQVPFEEEGMAAAWSEGPGESASSSAWRDMSLGDVTSALQEVTEPCRLAFQGHALDRRSYAELARELGVQPVTVGTRVLRARHQLRKILEAKILEARMGGHSAGCELNVHRNLA